MNGYKIWRNAMPNYVLYTLPEVSNCVCPIFDILLIFCLCCSCFRLERRLNLAAAAAATDANEIDDDGYDMGGGDEGVGTTAAEKRLAAGYSFEAVVRALPVLLLALPWATSLCLSLYPRIIYDCLTHFLFTEPSLCSPPYSLFLCGRWPNTTLYLRRALLAWLRAGICLRICSTLFGACCAEATSFLPNPSSNSATTTATAAVEVVDLW
jgi:hypothetical protein